MFLLTDDEITNVTYTHHNYDSFYNMVIILFYIYVFFVNIFLFVPQMIILFFYYFLNKIKKHYITFLNYIQNQDDPNIFNFDYTI